MGGRPGRAGRVRRRGGLDIGSWQRLAVLLVVAVTHFTLGLLARDLSPGPGHLDGDHDGADHERGEHQLGHRADDEADHRTDDQERDQYAGPDGGDLEPAHPPHPLSTRICPLSRYYLTRPLRLGHARTRH